MDTLYKEALYLHQKKQYAAAEKKYQNFLLWRNDNAEAYLNLGILYYETESYQEAISTLVKALGIDASNPLISYNLGLVLEKLKNDQQAISAYREAIKIAPNLIDAYNNLGNLLTKQEKMAEAESVYRKAIAANPEHFGSYLNLGNFLLERNQVNNAIEVYQTALALNPTHPDILNNLEIALQAKKYPTQFLLNLGEKLYQKNRYEEAIESYKRLLETELVKVEVYLNLRNCYINLNQIEEAISILQEGIHYHPKAGILRFYLIEILRQSGRTKEAITSATDAARQLPYEYVFKILSFLMLPIVYSTTDEVRFYRKQFARGLQNLIEQTSLETPEEKTMALKGVSSVTNFYLVYQAHNDRDLQHQYGNLVHQITAANYPKWVKPLPLPPLQENQKIRVGYISAYLHAYSGTYWLLGWLRHCDRQNFEIYCYYTGNDPDLITQQFQQYSEVFHHIPGNLEAVSQQILDDRLHILVFPEIGMDAPTIPIASLRLAPVQCTAWGHPVTSGLPTIDYYLSSELMEPENAQEHYTETLIRLPNLAIAYPKPDIPALTKTRSDFSLRDDAVVYLCCQAPFKYLPQHDFIFTEIARHVPQAQFVFIRADNLKPRLLKAFAAAGLKSEDYCVFLPFQARFDYLMLNLLCDVYLDSFGFSGGNTTLDAIACNLPIVTCPGEFMRGRLSYAMLTRLGLSETIAQDEAEYIDIAVRLGLEPVWRDWIVQYTAEHHDCLYNDTTCVAALEEFYQRVVQEGLTQR